MKKKRDLRLFKHYKQIEKMAGSNIRLCDSDKYAGTRRINGLGKIIKGDGSLLPRLP